MLSKFKKKQNENSISDKISNYFFYAFWYIKNKECIKTFVKCVYVCGCKLFFMMWWKVLFVLRDNS